MSKNTIITGQYVSLEFTLASLSDRIVGQIIDWLVLNAYLVVIFILMANGLFEEIDSDVAMYIFFALCLPYLLYFLLFEALNHGQTVGKMVMKTRVINQDGTSPTLSQYILRYILLFVDLGIFFVGLLPIMISRYHQRFGDLAAGTIVVSLKRQNVILPTYNFATTGYTPVYPEAQLLTVRQADVLSRVYYHTDAEQRPQLMAQLVDKLRSTFAIEPKTPDNDAFVRRVLDDYYYYCSTIEA